MGKQLGSSTFLRFAIASAVLIAIVAGTFGYAACQQVATSQENAASASTETLIGEPLVAALGDEALTQPLAAELNLRAQAVIAPALTGGITTIRIWTSNRDLLLTAGDADAGQLDIPNDSGVSSARTTAADGARFVTFMNTGAYTLELHRDAEPIDARITTAQWTLAFTVTIFALIGIIVLQAAFWIGTSRFVDDHKRLLTIYTSGQEIRSSLDLHDVVTQISRDATDLSQGALGLVALFEEETGELVLRATYDRETGALAHHQRAIDEWFLRRCAATNTTIVSSQAASVYQPFFGPELNPQVHVALVCVPMSLRDRVVGVVSVIRPQLTSRSGFAPNEVNLIEQVADQAVMAVEQALLFNKMRSYADELEMSYDTTLKVLMAALDTKDEVTEGHCERVAKLTVHLARSMGVTDKMLVDMERGALLHDVGKIGVPDAVLKKPAKLNQMEWEAMRKHPLLAGLMVSKVGFLEGALPILLYHHERYDGTGYPFGLVADKIPLEARIFSIIDAYDAMTSHRPYRAAMPHDVAMAEVRKYSGIQFDPDVVDGFEALMADRPDLRELGGHHHLENDHDHEEDVELGIGPDADDDEGGEIVAFNPSVQDPEEGAENAA